MINTVTDRLDLIMDRKLTVHEFRDVLKPDLEEIREKRIESAKEVMKEITAIPEMRVPETPEEFEEAARVLREEAKRRKTPKQIREEKRDEAKKIRDRIMGRLRSAQNLISVDEYQKQVKLLESVIEKEPDEALPKLGNIDSTLRNELKKAREEREKKRLEKEMRQRFEEEKIEEIKDELRKDETFKTEVRTELMKEMVSPSSVTWTQKKPEHQTLLYLYRRRRN